MQTIQTNTQQSAFHRVDLLIIAFWGTVILAFCLRFYDLANMPLHHDESLYGVYCWRFFTGQVYKYDPMMHGPFMFHFQLLIFFLFGVGDFSVRIAPALFGCLLIASTYYLKDFVGKVGILLIALFLTFSPTHLYFSRFMRHDSYMAFFTYTSAVFGLLYYRTRQKKHLYLTAAFLSLMFCVKENSYIHTFIFVTFLIIKEFCQSCLFRLPQFRSRFGSQFRSYLRDRFPDEYRDNPGTRLRLYLRDQRYPLIFAGFIFIWIYLLLYSTFFMNPGGVQDGLYRKSLTYWWNQHDIQRIKGPFHYYLQFFFLYELPVALIAVGGVLYKLSRTLNGAILAVWATIFSGGLIFFYGDRMLPLWLAFTHMEILADLILTLYVVFIGLWATLYFIKQRETLTAFFAYWSAIGFLIYSYAGEKVPWLFLYVMLPLFPLAGIMLRDILLFLSQVWHKRSVRLKILKITAVVIGGLFTMYTLHTTILLNYYNRANPAERMVYTQTSTDILKLIEVVRDVKFNVGSEEAKNPIIAVQGAAVWPLHWYLRDYKGWYHPGELHNTRRPLVVIDWSKREEYRKTFEDDYREIRVKLREWWIPEPNGSISDWWEYFLYRKVFNPTGSSDIAFYVRK